MKIGIVRTHPPRTRPGHFDELSKRELIAAGEGACEYILDNQNIETRLESLLKFCIEKKPNLIHIDWIHDLHSDILEIGSLLGKLQINWTTTGSIGRVLRKSNTSRRFDYESLQVLLKLDYLHSNSNFKSLFIFDNYLVEKHKTRYPFLEFMPHYEPNNSVDLCEYCGVETDRPLIGIAGSLFAYRGSEQLISYWNEKKSFRIGLIGEYFPNTHSKRTQDLLHMVMDDKTNLIRLHKILNSELLNHYVKHFDALYIDGRDYPEPSGIAFRALQLGVPIITEQADSFLADLSVENSKILFADVLDLPPTELKTELASSRNRFDNISGITELFQINAIKKVWKN